MVKNEPKQGIKMSPKLVKNETKLVKNEPKLVKNEPTRRDPAAAAADQGGARPAAGGAGRVPGGGGGDDVRRLADGEGRGGGGRGPTYEYETVEKMKRVGHEKQLKAARFCVWTDACLIPSRRSSMRVPFRLVLRGSAAMRVLRVMKDTELEKL